MRVRLQKQNIRFRLQPEDLDQLKTKKFCSESVEISPDLTLTFTLELNNEAKLSRVISAGASVKIEIPDHSFLDWIQGTEDDWDFTQASPRLDISIEKDFKPHHIN